MYTQSAACVHGGNAPKERHSEAKTYTLVNVLPAQRSAQNKLYRILRHLRDDVVDNNPGMTPPSSFLLKKLVENYAAKVLSLNFSGQGKATHLDWKYITLECLQFLKSRLEGNDNVWLYDPQSHTPLFDQEDSHKLENTKRFLQTAINYYRQSANIHS